MLLRQPLPPDTPSGPLCALGSSRPDVPVARRIREWIPARQGLDGAVMTRVAADRVYDMLVHSWAPATLALYGSGLSVFHAWCDGRTPPVPEARRCASDKVLILEFIECCAGVYAGSTVKNYVYGVRAWHTTHLLPWEIDDIQLSAALTAASRLAPPSSTRPKRPPATVDWLEKIAGGLDASSPVDAAVLACITVTFWSVSRLGELAVKGTAGSYSPASSPKRGALTLRVWNSKLNVFVSRVEVPRTKASQLVGEPIMWAPQPGAADADAAMRAHLELNDPGPEDHLFAHRNAAGGLVPLTWYKVRKRVAEVAQRVGVPALTGHSLRIGGLLVYLLRGVPFETAKVIGRWASDAWQVYLREHADVLAPYLQATPVLDPFVRVAMPVRIRR